MLTLPLMHVNAIMAKEKKLAARRFWKVQQGKKLEPKDDFGIPPVQKTFITGDEIYRKAREKIMPEDVQEALQKYEEVRMSIVKSGKFDPPKNANPISDTRQRNRELMAAMKCASRKTVKPGAPFYKDPSMLLDNRKLIKGSNEGELPKGSETQSQDQTKPSVPASKDKGPAPQINREPAGTEAVPKKAAPAKNHSKKPPSQETTSKGSVGKSTIKLTKNKAAAEAPSQAAGFTEKPLPPPRVKEPEVDPKYPGQIPKEVKPRSLCKPMWIDTTSCAKIAEQFSGEPDELIHTFTALSMISDKFEEVIKAHTIASSVIRKMIEGSVLATRGAVFETTILRDRENDLRVPLVRGCPCKDDGNKGYNVQDFLMELKALRHEGGEGDKTLYALLESAERLRAQKLGMAGKNYTYYWNKKTTTVEAVLPGETYERAMIRKAEEMDNLARITELYKIRKFRLRANRKATRSVKKAKMCHQLKKVDTKKPKDDKMVVDNQQKKEWRNEAKKNEKEKETNEQEKEENKKE
ncbi:unnamed protein product [Caenorhabditis auriculariae]|uniref:Uncharacterized protein n=1 Tax=Caenorhabditis auriculariae TaxID=2777116 RepID=A0A8S1H8H3_9PELO|nr:unnamed protein product [Caenorhabditis auriculariae]